MDTTLLSQLKAPPPTKPLSFDEPGTPGRKFRHENYKVQAYLGLSTESQRPIFETVDTGCGPNLISESSLPPKWRSTINPYPDPRRRAANGNPTEFVGTFMLTLTLGTLTRQIFFEVIRDLPVKLIFGTCYADKFITNIQPVQRRLIPIHSEPISILNKRGPGLILSILPPKNAVDFKCQCKGACPCQDTREEHIVRLARGITILQ